MIGVDKVSTIREKAELLVYEAQPCALSRSAHTSAPPPPDGMYVLPESAYRYTIYTLPAVVFALGDRVEVTDDAGIVYRGRTSDSFRYPGHCAPLTVEKAASFQKIKIIEGIDLIRTDIVAAFENAYIGKMLNDYDNKLLVIAM